MRRGRGWGWENQTFSVANIEIHGEGVEKNREREREEEEEENLMRIQECHKQHILTFIESAPLQSGHKPKTTWLLLDTLPFTPAEEPKP